MAFIGLWEVMFIFLWWGFPMSIGAYVAKNRGRHPSVGVLTGLVLSWLGVVVLLLLPVKLVEPLHAGAGTGTESTALRILEERYARGEIDREEYFQRRDDLGT